MRYGCNYSTEEIAFISANALHMTDKEIAAYLPGRTAHGIAGKRRLLQLQKPRARPTITAEEIAFLHNNHMTIGEYARALGRSKSTIHALVRKHNIILRKRTAITYEETLSRARERMKRRRADEKVSKQRRTKI